jgi:hypothetical protein
MIAVYVKPWTMTIAQYHEDHERLDASGAIPHGRRHHSCFGTDGHLRVFEIWDSQEDLNASVEHLVPILREVGIPTNLPPDPLPVVNMRE